jgi:hypothetical protein
MQIYINKNNQQLGPFAEAKVLEMLKSGELSANDLGIRQGESHWQKLGELYPGAVSRPAVASQPAAVSQPVTVSQPAVKAAAAPAKKSRKGLLLGCTGFFLFALLVAAGVGFFAYRNLFPSGTAKDLPETVGGFKIEDPKDLTTPQGNIWGTEKKYVTKYKKSSDSYAVIVLTEYASEAAAETFYAGLPASDWCKGDDPLYLSYKKGGSEVSKATYCKSFFLKHASQIYNVMIISQSRVDDAKDILDNLPFNAGAVGEVKK